MWSSSLYDVFSTINTQGYTGVLNVIEYAAGFVPVFLYNNQVIRTPLIIMMSIVIEFI